ncbi:MAG: hypothetical protein MUC39_03830 [Candidatus Omnitrophica bacterium]|nr:hypothetical protein [Candidatus Omnitrophota bacterium]
MKKHLPASRLFIAIFCLTFFTAFAEEPAAVNKEQIDLEKFPDKNLMQAAWDRYNAKQYDAALSYAERCIALYDTHAKKMQASLHAPIPREIINQYWVLNDVATAKFIKGRILWIRGDFKGAKSVLSDVVQNYTYAMAYDRRGWYWNVSKASEDMLHAIDLGIDFGDSSSSLLTSKAWESYSKKDYKSSLAYAEQCIKMYNEAAIWQQKSLAKYPRKEEISQYWALNDVGTCYYLAGKASLKLGDKQKSREYLKFLRKNLYYASCWDSKGWYWKVADAVKPK